MSTTANLLLDKLRNVEARYEELNLLLASPETVSDSKKYQKTAKAHADLGEIVSKFREYKDIEHSIGETQAMVREENDAELKKMAEEELASLQQRLAQCENDLKLLLLPKDPKSAPAPAAMKRVYLWPTSSACIRDFPNPSAGRSRSFLPIPQVSEGSRKSSR